MGYNIEDADDYGWDDRTLRDEFAMAALTGLLLRNDRTGDAEWDKIFSAYAYEIADAMLEARREGTA